jgi:hypothetical protein
LGAISLARGAPIAPTLPPETMSDLANTPQQQFQQNIKDRIQSQIGELLPDEVLQEMVQAGIKAAFFEPRKTRVERDYRTIEVENPPWFVEHIEQEFDKQVRPALDAWMAENPETIKELIDRQIEKGIEAAVMKGFYAIISSSLMDMRVGVTQYIDAVVKR